MARNLPLVRGAKYYAGANLPFYVSRAMVTDYLEGKGFQSVRWHDRDEPLPAFLDAKRDPQYSDDWDSWAEAEYMGTTAGVLDPPASPAWMRIELPVSATAPVVTLPAATPGTANAYPSQMSAATRVAPVAIVSDPVIVRQRRLGVASSVLGGFLVAWFGIGAIVRGRTSSRTQSNEVQP